MIRWALAAAGVSGFLAVAIGAFGAHALRGLLDDRGRAIYETASQYHLVHSIALAAAALAPAAGADPRWCAAAALAWCAGIVIFSGSLYTLAVTGVGWLGALTPLGGVALLAGWIMLAWSALAPR